MAGCQQSNTGSVAVYSLAMAVTSRNSTPSSSIAVGRRRLLAAGAALFGLLAASVPTGALTAAALDPGPSEPVASVPVAPPTPRQAVSIDLQTFRLIVPFRTQKDGGPWQI